MESSGPDIAPGSRNIYIGGTPVSSASHPAEQRYGELIQGYIATARSWHPQSGLPYPVPWLGPSLVLITQNPNHHKGRMRSIKWESAFTDVSRSSREQKCYPLLFYFRCEPTHISSQRINCICYNPHIHS